MCMSVKIAQLYACARSFLEQTNSCHLPSLSRGIIGSFFINGNLTAEKYENLLRDHVIHNIENLFDGDMQNLWFQQDGAGLHYAIRILESIFS